MRKIRDVLRLSAAGLSKRQIAASLGIGPTAAGRALRRAREAGISWPLPDDLGDAALESACIRRLRPRPRTGGRGRTGRRFIASCAARRDAAIGVEEYRATIRRLQPQPVCELYRAWKAACRRRCGSARGWREAVRRLCRHDDRHF